jgi:teichuronic acid biosynthesis glycosyltransferase TuaG
LEVIGINQHLDKVQVSIIIPVYNAAQYIEETLESVFLQSFKNFEIVVVDDCSTDETVLKCESFRDKFSHFKIISTPFNYGCPGGPRNIGIKHAVADWIAFLDADDIWHRDKLLIQLRSAESSNVSFVSSRIHRFENSSEFGVDLQFSKIPTKCVSYLSQMLNYQTPTSSVMVKRHLFEKLLFQEGMEFREDVDLWLRLHKLVKFSLKVDLELVGYRVIAGQISGNKIHMVKKTYFTFRNSVGVKAIFGPFTAAILTLCHVLRVIYLPNFKRGF